MLFKISENAIDIPLPEFIWGFLRLNDYCFFSLSGSLVALLEEPLQDQKLTHHYWFFGNSMNFWSMA